MSGWLIFLSVIFILLQVFLIIWAVVREQGPIFFGTIIDLALISYGLDKNQPDFCWFGIAFTGITFVLIWWYFKKRQWAVKKLQKEYLEKLDKIIIEEEKQRKEIMQQILKKEKENQKAEVRKNASTKRTKSQPILRSSPKRNLKKIWSSNHNCWVSEMGRK